MLEWAGTSTTARTRRDPFRDAVIEIYAVVALLMLAAFCAGIWTSQLLDERTKESPAATEVTTGPVGAGTPTEENHAQKVREER